MPRSAVTRRVHFNAAHRLHNPERPDDWNRATFGPCNNPSYHGHNYELDVTVEGEIDPETGYVMDLGRLNEQGCTPQLMAQSNTPPESNFEIKISEYPMLVKVVAGPN